MKKLLLFLALAPLAFPQAAPGPVTSVSSAPTGACTQNTMQIVGPGGTVYTCQSGTWTQLSGTGTVTGVTGTSPVVSSGGTAPAISISGVTAEQGNGAKLQLSTGTTTTNDCVKFDVNGNTVDAGAACGGATIPSTTNVICGNGSGNGADCGFAPGVVPTLTTGTVKPIIVSTNTTVYVAPSGLATCTYNGDGGQACTPATSPASNGTTKAAPYDSWAHLNAIWGNAMVLPGAHLVFQQANDGGSCLLPQGETWNFWTFGGLLASSYWNTQNSIPMSNPSSYVTFQGDTTTDTNVTNTGAATCGGTTAATKVLFNISGGNVEFTGMKIQYFVDAGVWNGGGTYMLVNGPLHITSDNSAPGQNGAGFITVGAAIIRFGGTITVSNTGWGWVDSGIMFDETPTQKLNLVYSATSNPKAFWCQERAKCFINSMSAAWTGSGAYTVWGAQNGGELFNQDGFNGTWTINAPNATFYKTLGPGSKITDGCGAVLGPTCTLTAIGTRAAATLGGEIFLTSTTIAAGTNPDTADPESKVWIGSTPIVTTTSLNYGLNFNGLGQVQWSGFGASNFHGFNMALVRGNGSATSPTAVSGTAFNLGAFIGYGFRDTNPNNVKAGSAYRITNPSGTWSTTNAYGRGVITSVAKNTTTEIDTLIAQNGHAGLGGNTPTVAANACGATSQGTISAGSSDSVGEVTVGTATVTSCAITFGVAFGQETSRTPICTVSVESGSNYPTSLKGSATTTTLTITSGTLMDGDVIAWSCFEPKGQ